ncbi:hypothetical protein BH11VER1_BH11VER1_11450 [soil metagenome]
MKTLLLILLLSATSLAVQAKDPVDSKSLSANDYLEGLVCSWNAADFPAHKLHFSEENEQSYNPTKFAQLRFEYGTWDKSLYFGAIERDHKTLYIWKVWFEKKKYPELFKLYVSSEGEITGLWLQE